MLKSHACLTRGSEQAEVLQHEPHLALLGHGVDGLQLPRSCCLAAARLLAPGGFLGLEVGGASSSEDWGVVSSTCTSFRRQAACKWILPPRWCTKPLSITSLGKPLAGCWARRLEVSPQLRICRRLADSRAHVEPQRCCERSLWFGPPLHVK